MAKCDEGYICCVCNEYVDSITESELYLRFVIGLLDPELLHVTPEKHIRCNPTLAQFIVDDDFEPVKVNDEFGKSHLDREFVVERERLVTRGWRRLKELRNANDLSVLDFPLPEIVERLGQPLQTEDDRE